MEFTCELKTLKAHTIVGLYPFERIKKQFLIFDLKYTYKCDDDLNQDLLLSAPDYVQVAEKLLTYTNNSNFNLLEKLLIHLSEYLLNEFKTINTIEISVLKPAAYPCADGPKIYLKKNRN